MSTEDVEAVLRELAEEYSSRVNDELFAPNDLIVSRWLRDYVRKKFEPR